MLVGPGMVDAARFVGELLPRLDRQRVVLDADALRPELLPAGEVALTPHAGEMAQLLGISRDAIEKDPAASALGAAKKFGAAVALKGAATFIAGPDGRLICNREGSRLGRLLARPRRRPAVRKVAPLGYLPRELLAEIPREMARLSR